MTEDNTAYPILSENTPYPDYRRDVVVRHGHFRVDRLSFRTKRPADPGDFMYYAFVFEVDTEGEFGVGLVSSRGILSPSDLRWHAFDCASVWRRAHTPPPVTRPKSVPYYRRRVGPADAEREGETEEWLQDTTLRMPGRPTIDVDEAAALIEAAMHELAETETGEGRGPTF